MSNVHLDGSHTPLIRSGEEKPAIREGKNGTANDGVILDELLFRERYSTERPNAWTDSYRTISNRFDTTLRNRESWNYIAFSVILLRKCLNHFILKTTRNI